MCISEDFDPNYDIFLSEFKCKFDVLYEKFQLPMTLKIHVIVDYYALWRLLQGNMKFFFKLTNGEHHEAIHHTIKVFEAKKNFRMTNNLGSLIHQAKCLQSISTFNVLRAGYHTKGY